MRHPRRRFVLLAAALVVVVLAAFFALRGGWVVAVGYEPHGPPDVMFDAASQVEEVPDPRPAFAFDPSQPWQIDLGRGSGQYGLDTVSVTHNGRAVLHRQHSDSWERAELTLPPDSVGRIADAVNAERLTALGREYHAKGVFDGTQWVL